MRREFSSRLSPQRNRGRLSLGLPPEETIGAWNRFSLQAFFFAQ